MRFLRKVDALLMAALVALGAAVPVPAASAPAHAHAHPAEGPHHGTLIELGREDYHAELVHDDKADTVTIYILDAAATEAVPIAAAPLLLNVRAGGTAQQFPLAAKPQSTDPAGSSSASAGSSPAARPPSGSSSSPTASWPGRAWDSPTAAPWRWGPAGFPTARAWRWG